MFFYECHMSIFDDCQLLFRSLFGNLQGFFFILKIIVLIGFSQGEKIIKKTFITAKYSQ